MPNCMLIAASGPDHKGLIAALAGSLFDLGANLTDSDFHMVGTQFSYRAVADFPDGVGIGDIRDGLASLSVMGQASLEVSEYPPAGSEGDADQVTHRVLVEGEDRPGLVARLAEVLTDYDANIVRMSSEQHEDAAGRRYATRFHVNTPAARVTALDNALSNLAGTLRLTLAFEAV